MSTPPRIELDRAIRLAINQTTPSELAALGSSLGRTQPTSTPKRVLGPRPNVINPPFQINSSQNDASRAPRLLAHCINLLRRCGGHAARGARRPPVRAPRPLWPPFPQFTPDLPHSRVKVIV